MEKGFVHSIISLNKENKGTEFLASRINLLWLYELA